MEMVRDHIILGTDSQLLTFYSVVISPTSSRKAVYPRYIEIHWSKLGERVRKKNTSKSGG